MSVDGGERRAAAAASTQRNPQSPSRLPRSSASARLGPSRSGGGRRATTLGGGDDYGHSFPLIFYLPTTTTHDYPNHPPTTTFPTT